MQKVDIAIGVLGAVALLATGLGIALYDNINGLEDYTVDISMDQTLANDGNVPAGGLTWEFDAPANAYGAGGDLTIDWSGTTNPSLSGDVDVTVTVTGPDGTVDTLTETFDFSANSGVVALELSAWAEVPEDFSGSPDDAEAMTLNWDDPVTIEIVIQGPTGQLPLATQDDPVYTADLAGNWHTYSLVKDLPEPETA